MQPSKPRPGTVRPLLPRRAESRRPAAGRPSTQGRIDDGLRYRQAADVVQGALRVGQAIAATDDPPEGEAIPVTLEQAERTNDVMEVAIRGE